MRLTLSSRFSIGGVLQNDTPNGGKVNRKSSNCDGNFEENFERRVRNAERSEQLGNGAGHGPTPLLKRFKRIARRGFQAAPRLLPIRLARRRRASALVEVNRQRFHQRLRGRLAQRAL